MRLEEEGLLVRIFVGEDDRFESQPLYQAIVEAARKHGLAGATVIRGILGFGANSVIHTTKILRLSEDLPIIIELVDQPDRIESFLPQLDDMVTEGLITQEKIRIIAYRHSSSDSD